MVMWISGVATGVVVTLALWGLGLCVVQHPAIRARLRRSDRLAAWWARCDHREFRLEEAGVNLAGLQEVTVLVRELDDIDPSLSAHLELESLLDRYADLALLARKCEQALAMTARRARSRHAVIEQRSTATRVQLLRHLQKIREELEAILELLCLLIHRSVLESGRLEHDPIGDRLTLLGADEELAA